MLQDAEQRGPPEHEQPAPGAIPTGGPSLTHRSIALQAFLVLPGATGRIALEYGVPTGGERMATRVLYWLVGIAVLVAGNRLAAVQSAVSASPERTAINQYCVTCHNDRTKAGGLSLASVDPADAGANPASGKRCSASFAHARCRRPACRRPDERDLRAAASRHLEKAARSCAPPRIPIRAAPIPSAA